MQWQAGWRVVVVERVVVCCDGGPVGLQLRTRLCEEPSDARAVGLDSMCGHTPCICVWTRDLHTHVWTLAFHAHAWTHV
eukprot:365601-Chlamydomonas_euryale.AAC.6